MYGAIHRRHKHISARQLLREMDTGQRHCDPSILGDCDGAFIILLENRQRTRGWVFSDPLGNLRAHIFLDGHDAFVSDRPAQLLPRLARHGAIRLNRQRLIEHFASAGVSGDGSFFRDIQSVLPGHGIPLTLSAKHGQKTYHAGTQCAYYRLPDKALRQNIRQGPQSLSGTTRYWNKALRDAICANLQHLVPEGDEAKTAISLSGGLDSGLIAACLASRQTSRKFPALGLSYAFARFPSADESAWLHHYQNTPIRQHIFDASKDLPLTPPWPMLTDAPTSTPYRHIKKRLYIMAKENGCDQLLTGVFADHLYSGWIYHGMDTVRAHAWQVAARQLLRPGVRLKDRLAPYAPGKWRRPVRFSAPWLHTEARRALGRAVAWPTWHARHLHPQQALLVNGLYAADSVWLEEIFAHQNGVALAHPFRDKQLVEMLMQAPAWVLGNRQNRKQLARLAAIGLLPKDIAQRTEPRSLRPVFIAGVLEKNRDMAWDTLRHTRAGWAEFVRPEVINNVLSTPPASAKSLPESQLVTLWQCLSFELWLHALRRNGWAVSL